MSGGLAPSKSTVYVSNLPFSLTNNDLHKIFNKFGQVAKVTIMKDRDNRKSRGVAFILFLKKEEAQECVKVLNGKEMFGRTLKCSIARDNGRAADFIRRKNYPDKSRCYECGEAGHLSYQCPKNALGEREPPKKKERKRKKKDLTGVNEEEEEEDSDVGEDPRLDSLGSAIQYQQEKVEEEKYRLAVATGSYDRVKGESAVSAKRPRIHKNDYFSDEEDLSD